MYLEMPLLKNKNQVFSLLYQEQVQNYLHPQIPLNLSVLLHCLNHAYYCGSPADIRRDNLQAA